MYCTNAEIEGKRERLLFLYLPPPKKKKKSGRTRRGSRASARATPPPPGGRIGRTTWGAATANKQTYGGRGGRRHEPQGEESTPPR